GGTGAAADELEDFRVAGSRSVPVQKIVSGRKTLQDGDVRIVVDRSGLPPIVIVPDVHLHGSHRRCRAKADSRSPLKTTEAQSAFGTPATIPDLSPIDEERVLQQVREKERIAHAQLEIGDDEGATADRYRPL